MIGRNAGGRGPLRSPTRVRRPRIEDRRVTEHKVQQLEQYVAEIERGDEFLKAVHIRGFCVIVNGENA